MDAEKINDQEVKILEASLASVPIFQGCEEFLIKQIAKKAQCRRYDGHEEIVFSDQVPLLVVLSGAVRICIGCAPDTDAGPGSVLNVPGMLGLHELAEPYKPKAGKPASDPNDDLDDCVSMDPKTAQGPLKDEVQNIYNLCPISCYSSQKQTNLSGWLRMDIKPADGAGAKVAMVSLDLVEKVLAKGDALRPFHANLSRLTDQFICILRHGMFPGVPPEVIWLIACGTQRRHYAPKETLVEEDDLGELADWLIAINSGKADVEKLSYNGEEAVPQTIGSLSEGAVMGDVCFLHGGVPRGATVRAQTEVDAIAIPPSVILDALAMFPGITSSFMGRLREIVMQLQGSLPRPAQALKGMQIFSSCDLAFLRAVASVSERKVFFAGDQVREERIIDDTLRVIELGRCRVERRREGGCGVEFCGSCEVGTVLGERRFFNMPSMWPDATFKISTPLALLLFIPRQSFNGVLDTYPSEQQRSRQVKENTKTDGGNAKREHDAASVTILQGCGSGFLQAIAGCIRTVTYKIGQTITVQGAVDSSWQSFNGVLDRLTDQFICILRHGMFPGVPPEVVWLIACGTQQRHYAPKETLVEEDDLGELADWLIAINSGKVDVKTLSYNGEGRHSSVTALEVLVIQTDKTWEAVRGAADDVQRIESECECWRAFMLSGIASRCRAEIACRYHFREAASLRKLEQELGIRNQQRQLWAAAVIESSKACVKETGEVLRAKEACVAAMLEIQSSETLLPEGGKPCNIAVLDRKDFWKIVHEYPQAREVYTKWVLLQLPSATVDISCVPILQFLESSQVFIRALAGSIRQRVVPPGVDAITAKDFFETLVFLQQGLADVVLRGHKVRELRAGQSVGELNLLSVQKMNGIVIVSSEFCVSQELKKQDVEMHLSKHPVARSRWRDLLKVRNIWKQDGSNDRQIDMLRESPFFYDDMPVGFAKAVHGSMEVRLLFPEEVVQDKDDPTDVLCLVCEGQMERMSFGKKSTLDVGGIWGEAGLLSDKDGPPETLVAKSVCGVMALHRINMIDVFDSFPEEVPQTIGSLSEGAVMGDVCFLHGRVPRGATVRAQTEACLWSTSAFLCRW